MELETKTGDWEQKTIRHEKYAITASGKEDGPMSLEIINKESKRMFVQTTHQFKSPMRYPLFIATFEKKTEGIVIEIIENEEKLIIKLALSVGGIAVFSEIIEVPIYKQEPVDIVKLQLEDLQENNAMLTAKIEEMERKEIKHERLMEEIKERNDMSLTEMKEQVAGMISQTMAEMKEENARMSLEMKQEKEGFQNLLQRVCPYVKSMKGETYINIDQDFPLVKLELPKGKYLLNFSFSGRGQNAYFGYFIKIDGKEFYNPSNSNDTKTNSLMIYRTAEKNVAFSIPIVRQMETEVNSCVELFGHYGASYPWYIIDPSIAAFPIN